MENEFSKKITEIRGIIGDYNLYGEKIRIVGASKTQSADVINGFITAGLNEIGENRVQEFMSKLPFLLPCKKHVIGHLQTNKAKLAVLYADSIDSVDSLRLAESISGYAQKRNKIQEIMIEVNVGSEISKSGFAAEETVEAAKAISKLNFVKLNGLMTVLPANADLEKLRSLCLQMRKLYDIIRNDVCEISVLSMGMSHDFKTAIECGSNEVRLGTMLFGQRQPTKEE